MGKWVPAQLPYHFHFHVYSGYLHPWPLLLWVCEKNDYLLQNDAKIFSSWQEICVSCSEKKICLGLCICTICSSGSLCTYFLLLGKNYYYWYTDTTHMFLELEVLILLFMSINCRFEYKQCYQFFFLHLLVLELQWVEVQYLSSSWDGEDDNRRWETNCIQFFWVDGLNQLKCWQQQQHHHRLRPHWLL